MPSRILSSLLLSTSLLASPAAAQDAALLLGQERYEQLDRVRGADDILSARTDLEGLGFVVAARSNGRVDAVKDLAAAFQADLVDADRLLVALTGHFVTDGTRTWLLTAEATTPDLFTVDEVGLSVDSLVRILSARQGKALLLLGQADPDDLDMDGSALQAGIGEVALPQGVTLIRTTPGAASDLLDGPLTEPEAVIGERLLSDPDLEIDGYLPPDWVLMPGEVIIETPAEPITPTEDDLTAEAELWDEATTADTVEAYRRYLARFPEGRFVDVAEEQIEAILSEPNRDARLAEEALGLSRSDRRDIQSNLTLLNYNTRGVDGIFGPGSRGAITNWQQSNGFPQTSYLTQGQINLLDAQAARRQAEIDAEEARARQQAEALDRSYWSETGGRGDEPGYRAYLDRYPEGLFANIARARLGEIEERRQSATDAEDRAAWARAEDANTVVAYQEYLASFSGGLYADMARTRIAELTEAETSASEIERARAEEARLQLSGVRAQLLELRLRDIGLDPGRLDGVIDEDTRRAIAAYQDARDIPATGFVDQQTAVTLLTGSINFTIRN